MAFKKLIVVESPTKARTISQYLGKRYHVLSSQGHVRDLPKNELGVEIEKEFAPKFETKRTKYVKALREAAKHAPQIYLATDHDREGEAIAYDLYTILKRVIEDESAFSRPVFNEITKTVIEEALEHPAEIDLKKVEAQRTRRILDRLVGYLVSPRLSQVLAGSRFMGLSAGRVQSVALRFLCDREGEIARFVPEEYWEIDVHLKNGEPFVAALKKKNDAKLAIHQQVEAEAIVEELKRQDVEVKSLTESERRRQPAPPFITSSLQQSASSVFGFTPKRTMRTAQQLYEGISLPEGNTGLITYMRTDSLRVSEEAIKTARGVVERQFGRRYLSPSARRYKNKKRSQDAHEAIRPTDLARVPEKTSRYLTSDQRKLYSLIYHRFLATQMTPAVYRQRKIVLAAGAYTLEAAGSVLDFDGFLKLFPAETERKPDQQTIPADVREGQRLAIEQVEPRQKFTEPPRRYSEAGLINLLEKEGIGRPSTYASIVSVIQERGYVVKEKGSLRPTLLGQTVVSFLKQYFSETVETRFTAHMEEDLDRVEEGELTRLDVLNEFYEPFSKRLDALDDLMEDGKDHPFRVMTDVICEKCGAPMELRYWKGSHFLGCSRYPECRSTQAVPPDLPYRFDEEGDLVIREALEMLSAQTEDEIPCPHCGEMMTLRTGRYGRYYRCTACDKTASISTGVACPTCGDGMLVEKYSSRKRRRFYSCNNYPDCRFAVSDLPIKSCPACESGVLVEKGGGLRCSNKACSYKEELPEGES
jgi:DNA topoisomerase-1